MKKLFPIKKTVMLIAVVLLGITGLSAQTTIMVGASQTYTKIQDAYTNGIPADISTTGAYIIELQSDYDPTLETYPITFAAKTGASATNSITVKPATGVKKILSNPSATVMKTGLTTTAAATVDVLDATGITTGMYIFGTATNTTSAFPTVTAISGSVITAGTTNFTAKSGVSLFFGPSGTKTIVFSGATYVIIDGVSRTDATTGLTIQNPNNIVSRTLSFEGATYSTIRNCYIKGANISGEVYNSGNNGMIYFSGASNYNLIENNDICDIDGNIMPINMFIFANTGGGSDASVINTVQNNNIYNFGSTTATPVGNCGCFNFPSSASPNTWVLNNHVYWTKTIPAMSTAGNSTFFVIGFGSSSAGKLSRIEGNYIGGTASDGTGTAIFTPGTSTAITVINALGNSTIKNNQIFGISSSIVNGLNAIVVGNAYSNTDAGDVSGNVVHDIALTGAANNASIFGISTTMASATVRNVNNNSIYNLSAGGSSIGNRMLVRGIVMGGSSTATSNCIGNKVYNFTAGLSTSTANNFAIGIDLPAYIGVVEKNLVYNLNVSGTAATLTRTAYGIRTTGSNNIANNGTNGTVLRNNIVRLGTDMTDSPAMIYGIYQAAATTAGDPFKIYNNTVYIGGTATSTATIATSTYAFFRTGTVPANDIENNIFSNQRTINGGTANHYAISVAAITDVATITKNLYQYNGKLGAIATGSATTYADLAAWNSARAAVTPTALSTDASLDNVAPGFADATATTPDMHVSSSSPANQSGVVIASVTDDYSGALRADYTPADMGAYVISGSTAVSNQKQESASVYAIDKAILMNNLEGQTAHIYSLSGQLLKSVLISSDKFDVPSDRGFFIVNVANVNTKVLVK